MTVPPRASKPRQPPAAARATETAQMPADARAAGKARKPADARAAGEARKPADARAAGEAPQPADARAAGEARKPADARAAGEAPPAGRRGQAARPAGADQILDEIDRRVIKILQVDGRTPNTEIARQLRVSETTIRKRIAQLVSHDLINIVAVPTPKAVGMNLSAIIGISVTLPRLREISEELKRHQEVRYVGVSTGRYDIIVEAFFFDQQHFLEFISSKLSRMDGITGLETSMILEVVKFSYEWEIG